MEKICETHRTIPKRLHRDAKLLVATIFIMACLLVLRDTYNMPINRYIFLILLGGVTFLIEIESVMYLIAFVMPLYVGLPGNYITLIFLARFLFEYGKIKVKVTNFLFCMGAGIFALVQAIITRNTTISQLMFFPGLILVMFIFSIKITLDKRKLVLF